MQKLRTAIRTGVLYISAVVMISGYPMAAMAESTPPAVTTPSSSTAPPPKPPEPDSKYTYNPDTKHWDSDQWVYDPISGQYIRRTPPSAPTPPPIVTDKTATPPVADSTVPATTNSTSGDPKIDSTTKTTDNTVANTTSSITNGLDSTATSGNTSVKGNTTAGSATSGNASGDATVINTVQSAVGSGTTGVAHFTANINGDVNGDITLAPTINGISSASDPNHNNLQTNTNSKITNNINLNANSGNANVSGNTTAGNATSGSANTVANVINLINSIVAANKSFVGTINIYGNLNGDILISPEFIPQLIASNAPNLTNPSVGPLTANLNDTQSIVNNVSLSATTGTSAVGGNTTGGNATTGTGSTNLTILNLTGHQVVAKDSLLVFVNVLGKWVGLIVDAPVGATAAVLGSGVTSDTLTSGSQNINASNNSQITNNINLASHSGNASVTDNTKGGNATSGNATASANIANISTSTFSLSDWFGVLYINVFGSWYGSFGINTANGDIVPLSGMAVPPSNTQLPSLQFGFVPHGTSGHANISGITYSGNGDNNQSDVSAPVQAALASARINGNDNQVTLTQNTSPQASNLFNIIMMVAGAMGLVSTYAVGLVRRRQALA